MNGSQVNDIFFQSWIPDWEMHSFFMMKESIKLFYRAVRRWLRRRTKRAAPLGVARRLASLSRSMQLPNERTQLHSQLSRSPGDKHDNYCCLVMTNVNFSLQRWVFLSGSSGLSFHAYLLFLCLQWVHFIRCLFDLVKYSLFYHVLSESGLLIFDSFFGDDSSILV